MVQDHAARKIFEWKKEVNSELLVALSVVGVRVLEMEGTASNRSYSLVYDGLSDDAKKGYREKLDRIGCKRIDPYLPVDDPPCVEHPDVYNYLVIALSLYTKDSLKAHKRLEGYKYLVAGWVEAVSCFTTSKEGKSKLSSLPKSGILRVFLPSLPVLG